MQALINAACQPVANDESKCRYMWGNVYGGVSDKKIPVLERKVSNEIKVEQADVSLEKSKLSLMSQMFF